jgi:ribose transport system substrate-binding protein
MKKTSVIRALCVCLTAFFLILNTGCKKQKQETSNPNKITLGVCMSTFTSPYASATVREMKKYAQEKGYDIIILDSQLDIQREAYNIDNLKSKKVKAILVNVVDSKGSKTALKKAANAGFVVICFNSSVDSPETLGIRAYTGPQYYEQGATAARAAVRLKTNGNAVIISGTPGYSAAIEREKGFTDVIAKEAPNIKLLDIQTANWMREDAQRIMSDYITKYGDEIDIVYSQDDNMTAGAVTALKAAGYTLDKKPVVVSIGAMADGLPLIKDGWIDSSIMQSPKEESRLAIDTAIDIINGTQKEPYKNYFMKTLPVDKTNVQEVIDMHMWD